MRLVYKIAPAALWRAAEAQGRFDGAPVDLVCLVLTPVNGGKGRIDALACIAKRLRPVDIRERIRKAAGGEDIYALLLDES